MLQVVRIGDPISCGDSMANGSPTVYANSIPVSRLGVDLTAGHCFSPTPINAASITVYANNIPVNRIGDPIEPHCCPGAGCHGGNASGGSPNVYATDITMGDINAITSDKMMIEQDGQGDDAVAVANIKKQKASGLVTQQQIDRGNNAMATKTDNEEPTQKTEPTKVDCDDCKKSVNIDDSFSVGGQYTLRDVTLAIVFPHKVVDNAGLSACEIACNLKKLVTNCWIPIKNKYPNAFITSSFRPGSGNSQHHKGQAMDIQFKGAVKADYFAIAQWIKDNIAYDQLLLEYKTTGTGMPWIHISFSSSNRGQVLTLMNDKKFAAGLSDLSSA